jgi:hypothetical protein
MVSDISYTVFADVSAQHATLHTTAWSALCTSLTDPPVFPSKILCPLLKLATFGTARTPKGSLRHDFNVTAVSGVVADYDAEILSVTQAAAVLESYGLEAFFYTSASHRPDAPRWRVLLPFSVELAQGAYWQNVAVVNELLDGVLAAESFTLSQSFYFGRVDGVTYETRHCQGVLCIDELSPGFAGVGPPQRPRDMAPSAPWVEQVRRADAVDSVTPEVIGELRAALGHLAAQGHANRGAHLEWDRIRQALMCLGDDGRDLFVEFSALGDSENKRDSAAERFYGAGGGDRSTYKTVFAMAQESGWSNPRSRGAVDRQIQIVADDKYAALDEHTAALYGAGTVRELDSAAERARIDPRLTDDIRETLAQHYQRALEACGNPRLPIALCRVKLSKPRAVAVVDNFDRDGDGAIERTQKNLNEAMRALGFRYDVFTARIYMGATLVDDNTYTSALVAAEMMGCQSPTIQQVKLAVHFVAAECSFDSALDWGNALVWDGAPRIESCLSRVLGLEATPYIRGVSRYLWTALAGRLVSPGVKADAIPVLISEEEGFGKTTLVEAFAPSPEFFGELDMNTKREDTQRMLRGKLVLEWNELAGLKTRDFAQILSFITRRHEEFVDKFQTVPTKFPRRCMIIATANDTYFMDAHSTGRRFLPIEMGAMGANVELLRSENEQLWAEAIATFKANGVEWKILEHDAPIQRDKFREDDPLYLHIESFLNSPRPFGYGSIATVNYGDGEVRIAEIKAYLERMRLVRKMPSDVAISKLLKRKFGYELHKKPGFNVWIRP